MKRLRRTFSYMMTGAAILFVLLAAGVLLAPHLINTQMVKARILSEVSQRIGGRLECDTVGLHYLPRPHVDMRDAKLTVPRKIQGTISGLRVYPRVMSLLVGKFVPSGIEVERPALVLEVPRGLSRKRKGGEGGPIRHGAKGLLPELASLLAHVPDMGVVVKEASLDVSGLTEPGLFFRDIQLRAVLRGGHLKVDLESRSGLWERMSLKAALNSATLEGNGRLDLMKFRPHLLVSSLFPQTTPKISESTANVSVTYQTNGQRDWTAEVDARVPQLTLKRGKRQVVVECQSLKGTLQKGAKGITVQLKELDLKAPRLTATARLIRERASSRTTVELEAKNVDVASLRQTALAVGGDQASIREIFQRVKGGEVPWVTFKSGGNALHDLGETENMVIQGEIVGGKVSIPEVGLELHDVGGRARISKGILKGENLEAQWGEARAREGRLTVDLEKEDGPFHLDIGIETRLGQALAELKGLIKNRLFLKELSLIEGLRGTARGRLRLGETLASVKPQVRVSGFDLSAKYGRIPFDVKMQGGEFSYERDSIQVKDVSIELGKSSFSGVAARIDWSATPRLEIRAGRSDASLDEIYPWLSSFEGIRKKISDIEEVRGKILLRKVTIQGLLLDPENWGYEAEGGIRALSITTRLIPGQIKMSTGRFRATEKTMSVEDFQTYALDASLTLTGALPGYRQGLGEVDLRCKGKLGPEFTRWISRRISLPAPFRLRSPVFLKQGHFLGSKGKKVAFDGVMTIRDAPEISMHLIAGSKEFDLKRILIRDSESNAALSLRLKGEVLDLGFQGNLTRGSVRKIFQGKGLPTGWLEGDFKGRIRLDRPFQSTIQGWIKGKDLLLPWKRFKIIQVEGIDLQGLGDRLVVKSARVRYEEELWSLAGTCDLASGVMKLDMDLSTKNLQWEDVKRILQSETGPQKEGGAKGSAKTFLRGRIGIRSESFTLDRFVWRPLRAEIFFEAKGVRVRVEEEGRLCGIATPGEVRLVPGGVHLDFRPLAINQELGTVIPCLTKAKHQASGNFDLKGQIISDGKEEELLRSARGYLELTAGKGRIYHFGLLAKVLGFVNVTEVFRGRLPDLTEEGFPYNSAKVKATILEGKLMIEEGAVDGEPADIAFLGDVDLTDKKLDLKFLVAPLKTVDFVLKRIPLVNYIFGGSLVSVPVQVTGTWDDPKVSALSPKAVGAGLLGIMKKTLQVPLKVIEPITPH